MDLIERPEYLKEISSYKDHTGIIKIITGIRRCGKSTLFELYKNYLLNNGVAQEQIISINLDDIRNIDFLDCKVLFSHIESRLLKEQMNYVFLDEIQNVDKFQWVLNTLNNMKNVDLYATGSNSYLLSGEWATLLSGRYIQIQMYPLSFKEYLSRFKDDNKKVEDRFTEYMKYGGFPFPKEFLENKKILLNYLEGIYTTIIVKDIMQRGNISDSSRLEKTILFLTSNIGSITSMNNIKNQMASDGFSINISAVENYITSLINSFFLCRVPRYNISGKNLLKTNDKYYVADTGFRYLLLGEGKQDRGHLLENIVYLELLRRGYKVYVGKMGDIEVDFVASTPEKILYVQLCESLMGEETRKRELKPLENIRDNYEKIVLSMDNLFLGDVGGGIQHKNIIDWLLE